MNTEIKINNRKYKIKEVNKCPLKCEKGFLIEGQISYSKAIIYLNKNLKEEYKRITLFHEVLHGAFLELSEEFPQLKPIYNNDKLINKLADILNQIN